MESSSEYMAREIFNLAVALVETGHLEYAVFVFDDCIDKFQDSKDNAILGIVGCALWERIFVLRDMGRTKEALEAWDQFIV